jgi:hypothetical protein
MKINKIFINVKQTEYINSLRDRTENHTENRTDYFFTSIYRENGITLRDFITSIYCIIHSRCLYEKNTNISFELLDFYLKNSLTYEKYQIYYLTLINKYKHYYNRIVCRKNTVFNYDKFKDCIGINFLIISIDLW